MTCVWSANRDAETNGTPLATYSGCVTHDETLRRFWVGGEDVNLAELRLRRDDAISGARRLRRRADVRVERVQRPSDSWRNSKSRCASPAGWSTRCGPSSGGRSTGGVVSRCRRMPFKVACEDRWGCSCVLGRCAGYLSPPPTPWHAQPKCEERATTLSDFRAFVETIRASSSWRWRTRRSARTGSRRWSRRTPRFA